MKNMMNRTDLALLKLLQQDSTQSTAVIAEKLHISKSSAWRRIHKLEELGIIKHRTAILDANKLGLSLTVYISIRTNQHNENWFNNFKRITDELDQVLEVHRMSGDLDYLIKAVVKDMPDFDNLYQQLIKADLSDVSSSFVMEQMKSTTELPICHIETSAS